MGDLDGQVALVTGASRGIGKAIASAYARAGAHVIVAARTDEQLLDVVAEIETGGGSAEAVVMDVADHDSVEAGFRNIARSQTRLDIAVLNAGVFATPTEIAHSTLEDWRHCFDVNLLGVVDCARHAIPLMEKIGGKIIAIGSGTGYQANPGLGPYAASKAALASVVRTLAVELRPTGIAVNELIPGPVDTTRTPEPNASTSLTGAATEWFKRPEDVTDLAILLARYPNHGPSGQTFSLMGRSL